MEFQKWYLDLRLEWIHSKGLGTNSGQGEVWIGVPVQCYTECNIYDQLFMQNNHEK